MGGGGVPGYGARVAEDATVELSDVGLIVGVFVVEMAGDVGAGVAASGEIALDRCCEGRDCGWEGG